MVFDILLLGLSEMTASSGFLRSFSEYPHSELLAEAMNRLALASLVSNFPTIGFPRTLSGFLDLCHQSTDSWWPRGINDQNLALPTGFEMVPLLENGGLSEEAAERLYDALESENLPEYASSRTKKSGLENALLRELICKLRSETKRDRVLQANKEYQALRCFLIENPLPTTEDIHNYQRKHKMRIISAAEIGSFYENDDKVVPPLWVCKKCGPLLRNRSGHLVALKLDMGHDHWEASSHVYKIDGEAAIGRRLLKVGLQLRALIPGVPELELFRWLEKEQRAHSDFLREVTLWPGIDRYDYRLVWSDGDVWGVDFKDYRNPWHLGNQLKALPNQDGWNHSHSFYVFPDWHLKRNPDYKLRALSQAKHLPQNLQLLSDIEFQAQVNRQIKRLKKDANALKKIKPKETGHV